MERIRWSTAVVTLMVLTAQSPSVSAQLGRRQPPPDWRTTSTLGLGYVGNGPHALLGANLYLIRPVLGGLGLYLDFKIAHEDFGGSDLMVRDMTREGAQALGDWLEAEHESWRVFNVALVRPISAELAVYLGGGYGRETLYVDFYDEGTVRGFDGHYRFEDEQGSGTRVNLLGGGLFRIGRRVALHFGAESAPAGFNAGASLLLPLR